jgi:hypothetical protein
MVVCHDLTVNNDPLGRRHFAVLKRLAGFQVQPMEAAFNLLPYT